MKTNTLYSISLLLECLRASNIIVLTTEFKLKLYITIVFKTAKTKYSCLQVTCTRSLDIFHVSPTQQEQFASCVLIFLLQRQETCSWTKKFISNPLLITSHLREKFNFVVFT